jgi:hypothetical protein
MITVSSLEMRRRRRRGRDAIIIATPLIAAIVLACGGPGPIKAIGSSANFSGYVVTGGYHKAYNGIETVVGDVDGDINGSLVRGLIQFPLDSIPRGAIVTEAKLVLFQCKVAGHPFTKLGNVVVEEVTYNDPFDTSAFNSPRIGPALGVLSNNTTLEKKTLIITPTIQADLKAGRLFSQFRLRESIFDGNADSVTDYVAFGTVGFFHHLCRGLPPGKDPLLIVTYH